MSYETHFSDKKMKSQRLANLPKDPQLISGRARIQIESLSGFKARTLNLCASPSLPGHTCVVGTMVKRQRHVTEWPSLCCQQPTAADTEQTKANPPLQEQKSSKRKPKSVLAYSVILYCLVPASVLCPQLNRKPLEGSSFVLFHPHSPGLHKVRIPHKLSA